MRLAGRGSSTLAVLFLALGVSAGQAQEQITPQEFLDRAEGWTMTFTDMRSGNVVGVEQFLRRDLSVWAQSNGRCSYGDIELRGPLMCFIYQDFPDPDNCWMPFDADGELMVLSTDTYQTQRITKIDKTPVDCVGAPLS